VAGVLFNTVLMALNLLPILPLDGGRVLNSLLPPRMAVTYSKLEAYGLIIVIVLLATGLLGYVLWPLVGLTISLLPATDIVLQYAQVILGSTRS
jgi:Zn-dependent protease